MVFFQKVNTTDMCLYRVVVKDPSRLVLWFSLVLQSMRVPLTYTEPLSTLGISSHAVAPIMLSL